jgi:serine/threonine-protein kinase
MQGSLGRLGQYEVTGVLGRGGFGVVLKAHDSALNRTVAIKVLAAQLAASAAARSRFAREAKAAAAVVHDNVVAVHAVDSWNGLPYLVMSYVPGQSLQQRVDRDGPLEVKEVLRIGMQAALGLAAAHAQGLVHRDVKPSNILLEHGVERVKLSDFGLARAVDDASLTQSGVVSGTPQYMSPEQARGEAVDYRSDLFSLGSTLYFMCAGHPPFRADSTPAVLRRVCDERPRPLHEINTDVPVWLADIVERLQAKEPDRRYGSATEVAELLQHHLAELQRTGTSAPPRPMPQAPVGKRMGRKTFASVVLVCAALFASVLSGLLYSRLPPKEQSPLVADGDPSAPPIIGSGRPAVKSWNIADFTAVEIEEGFRAEISKGKDFKITTSSDDNVIERIQVLKEDKTLRIGLKPGQNLRLKEPLKAAIVLPVLDALTVRDGTKAVLKGFRSEKQLTLVLADGSTVEGPLHVGNADFQLHDGSTLALTGTAADARLSVHDGSHLKLQDFILKQCKIKLADSSTARITVRSDKPFRAELSDGSSLDGSVDAKAVEIKLKDSSHATLSGSAKNAEMVAVDSSDLRLASLIVEDARIVLSDSSRATVDVRKSLKYVLSSSATLEYSGDPSTLTGIKSREATIRRRP